MEEGSSQEENVSMYGGGLQGKDVNGRRLDMGDRCGRKVRRGF